MPYPAYTTTPARRHTATIVSGASLSDSVAIPYTHTLIGIVMPAAWDTAALTFQGSFDGSTFGDLYDDTGTEVTVPTAAGRVVYISDANLRAVIALKLRSGTAGTPVNQTAERLITVLSHP